MVLYSVMPKNTDLNNIPELICSWSSGLFIPNNVLGKYKNIHETYKTFESKLVKKSNLWLSLEGEAILSVRLNLLKLLNTELSISVLPPERSDVSTSLCIFCTTAVEGLTFDAVKTRIFTDLNQRFEDPGVQFRF